MEKIKMLNVRMPKELWFFLKHKSLEDEKSMNQIVVNCIEKLYKKENKN